MAKRRKQYRGTPEQHRRGAAGELINVKRSLRAMGHQLDAGRCAAALDFLINAENSWGSWEVNREHATKGGKMRKNAAFSPVASRLNRAKARLKRECFR